MKITERCHTKVRNTLIFLLHHPVGPEVSKTMTLVDFLREQVKLPGTKVLCREGGCGVCTVVATAPDPEHEGAYKTFSVNAVSLHFRIFFVLLPFV